MFVSVLLIKLPILVKGLPPFIKVLIRLSGLMRQGYSTIGSFVLSKGDSDEAVSLFLSSFSVSKYISKTVGSISVDEFNFWFTISSRVNSTYSLFFSFASKILYTISPFNITVRLSRCLS